MARPHPDHTRFKGIEATKDDVFPSQVEHLCAVPRCTNPWAHEHHAWSRTQIRKKGGGGWNLIEDTATGDVIVNVIPLCFTHHQDLHEARARLYYDPFIKWFYWKKLKQVPDRIPDDAPLKYGPSEALLPDHHANTKSPQTVAHTSGVVVGEQRPEVEAPVHDSSLGDEEGAGVMAPSHPHAELRPGETCPTCQRRKPHPKKESSPNSKTKAYRLPVNEETAHKDVYEAAAEYVGAKGKPFEQFKVYTIALAALLQDEGWRGFYDREAAA